MKRQIARWESRGGKHWVNLYYDPAFRLVDGRTVSSADYEAPDCGGNLGSCTETEAARKLQVMVDTGYFQPDANKAPMKRVL